MTIFAKIKDDAIVTSPTKKTGYKKFIVRVPEQLHIVSNDDMSPDTEETTEGEEVTPTPPSIEVTTYNDYKAAIYKQIDNVYGYLIEKDPYAPGTKANRLLENLKQEAYDTVSYLKPPTTTEEEEANFTLEVLIEDKLKEIKAAKKAVQNAPVISPIDGKDYTFYGGAASITKYSAAMDLAIALGKTSRDILTYEGMVSITKPDMDIAILKMSMVLDEAWHKEIELITAIYKAKTADEIEAISW